MKKVECKNVRILTEDVSHFERLGMVVSYCIYKKIYPNWDITDIGRYFLDMIILNQLHIFVCDGSMVGFVSWAAINREESDLIRETGSDSVVSSWNSGSDVWIIDFVSASGCTKEIAKHLEFAMRHMGSIAWAIRRNPDGSVKRFAKFVRNRLE